MAVAGVIGAAVGIMLLIIVAYVLVGNVLTTAEVVTNAQKETTLQNAIRLGTSFEISNPHRINSNFNISISNTGSEIIRDFPQMDVFVYDDTDGYMHLTYNRTCGTPGTWCLHNCLSTSVVPDQLKPDYTACIDATLPVSSGYGSIRVVTGNGVYDSART